MGNETQIWNKILTTVLKMPGVKVDRISFLRKALQPYCNQARLQMLGGVRPYSIVSDGVIDRVARACINKHTALATAGSTIAGLPGGLAMAATLPGDLTQYYYHVFVLSQKLAYLYGFPDFCDEEGELSDEASDLLTIFMGSMMGVKVADQGISEIAKGVAQAAVGRLPRVIISELAIVPIAKQIARMVGAKLSKESVAKGVGKFVPVAGGIFSGTLTFFTFRPGAVRLQKRLKAQRQNFNDGDLDALEFANIRSSFVKAEQSQNHPEDKQRVVVETLINMGNINGEPTQEQYALLEEQVARLDIDEEAKVAMLELIGTDHDFDIDYDLLACDPDYSEKALRGMIAVMKAGGKETNAERMYLTMAAKAMGISKDTLDDWLAETAKL